MTTEIFRPIAVHCRPGEVDTKVFLGEDQRGNITRGYIPKMCSGCRRWSPEEMKEIEKEIREVWGGSGFDREENFEVLVVEEDREGKQEMHVGYCTPTGSGVEEPIASNRTGKFLRIVRRKQNGGG